ncbi:Twinfilin-1 [Taxawa tesnikishii (nom. ined.)]|nr:Twinfilin-1 [Dothideales sp. JES 119]
MQSGISATQELHTAFNDLVSSPSVRGLLASISGESLVPSSSLTSTSSSFTDDLSQLQNLLKPNEAAYILLKQEHGAPDGFVAVTYVPNSAPVRQKMLFASTRLTLVRELGVERFRETIFCTEKEELTKEGWRRHEQHTKLAAPLTEEEEGLRGLRRLRRRRVEKIDPSTETLHLASHNTNISPADLSSTIESSAPRYTFYKYPGVDPAPVVFIYTCPSSSKIKERMLYAASRARVVNIAETEAGLQLAKRLEASEPSEFSESMLSAEFEEKKVESKGFARPKRPGRR